MITLRFIGMIQKARKTKMWYKVKARDNTISPPHGIVLTFSVWADSIERFWELMKERKHTEVKILGQTSKEWTPEWANSFLTPSGSKQEKNSFW